MTRPRQAITILLAEDDPDDRMLTVRALGQTRIQNEVRTVVDGEDLLDYLHRRGPYGEPDGAPRPGLILLDLNMPRMDGREALREIRSNPDFRSIPVIALTTSEATEDVETLYDLGANAFITKPVSFRDLVKAVNVMGDFWLEIVRLPQREDV